MTTFVHRTDSIAFTDNHAASALSTHAPECTSSFAEQLKNLRTRTWSKQTVLSSLLGCSDAAVSLWESGARLPRAGLMDLLMKALAAEGVAPVELETLHQRWSFERRERLLAHHVPFTPNRPPLS
jgi:DNA-binding transcriptional regulator YiaG